jgi:hypothetical protein
MNQDSSHFTNPSLVLAPAVTSKSELKSPLNPNERILKLWKSTRPFGTKVDESNFFTRSGDLEGFCNRAQYDFDVALANFFALIDVQQKCLYNSLNLWTSFPENNKSFRT